MLDYFINNVERPPKTAGAWETQGTRVMWTPGSAEAFTPPNAAHPAVPDNAKNRPMAA